MTAITILAVADAKLEQAKPPQQENSDKKRKMTDTAIIFMFIFFIATLASFPFFADLIGITGEFNGNSTVSVTTTGIFDRLFPMITPNMIFFDDLLLLRNVNWDAIIIVIWYVYLFIRVWDVLYKGHSENDYVEHYTIINGGRTIVTIGTAIYLKFIKSYWADASKLFSNDWIRTECFMFLIIITMGIFLLAKEKSNYRNCFRIYAVSRNLMLFQILTFAAVSPLLTYVLGLTVKSQFFIYHLIASCILLFLIHDWIKMVIILASSTHNWNEKDAAISFKTILSSIITISRYHCGTLCFYVYPIKRIQLRSQYAIRMNNSVRTRCIPYDRVFIMKYTSMLTAIYGVDAFDASRIVCYLEKKGKLKHDIKNKQSRIRTDITTILIAMHSIMFMSVNADTELTSTFIIYAFYILVNVNYFYMIVDPVNIVKDTIRFCRMVKPEDLQMFNNECKREESFEKVETS